MTALGDLDGSTLLGIARSALEAAVTGVDTPIEEEPAALGEPHRASFVTLTRKGELRGCIGTLDPHRPLADDVRRNARAAALRDTRFPPVRVEELPEIKIEVSVLSPLVEIEHSGEEDLLARLRPGIDGLLIAHRGRRATFLPQVWENLPRPIEFLRALEAKGGIPRDLAREELRAWRFTVEEYRE